MVRKTYILLCAMMVVVISLFAYTNVHAQAACVSPDCCTQEGYGGYEYDFSVYDTFPYMSEGETPVFRWDVKRRECLNGCSVDWISAFITIPKCVAGDCEYQGGYDFGDNIDSVQILGGGENASALYLSCDEGGNSVIEWYVNIGSGEEQSLRVELKDNVAYDTGEMTVDFYSGGEGGNSSCTLTGVTCPESTPPIGQIGQASFKEVPIGNNNKLCINLVTEEVSATEQASDCPGTPLTANPLSDMEISIETEDGERTPFEPVTDITNQTVLKIGENTCYPWCYNGYYYVICY